MIIGFDAKRALSNSTGLGSYSRTLINGLIQTDTQKDFQFRLYAPDKGQEVLRNKLPTADNLRFVYPKGRNNKLMRDFWREKGIVKDLINDKVDIFHGLSGQLPCGIKAEGIKTVVTVHDLIFFSHPEFYNPIDVWIYKRKFYSMLRNADRIIATSECTERDILKYGNFNASKPRVTKEKIQVIYQGYNNIYDNVTTEDEKQRVRTEYSLPERFILNVGSIERRKNVLLAVKALTQLPEDVHIVVIGKYTPYVDKIVRFVNMNNLNGRIHIYNNVSDEDLKAIYSLAEIFVYPSVYEGFGIPVIEAIANNLPVVAAKGSCLEEAGGEYSYYVENNDVSSMAEVLQTLLDDENKRKESVLKSKEYIKKFANDNIAGKILSLYEDMLR